MRFSIRNTPIWLVFSLLLAPLAHAQWAVIDVAAVARLSTEIQTLQQSLTTERAQFTEAQQALQAMTGSRGMENLLAQVKRNYLPESGAQLSAALAGHSGQYPGLTATIHADLRAEQGLTPTQLGQLSQRARTQLLGDRQTAALLEAVATEALANASGRFSQLQQLISAIGTARDQKAILGLTARIGAEQNMLVNEQTKLRVLFATARARHWIDEERRREGAIAAQGDFASRFQPRP